MVDQEPLQLEVTNLLIQRYFKNSTILLFKDGALALSELSRAEPDLLITNMYRPGMSGWKMLPLLVERKVRYPILVMDRLATEEEVRKCAGSGLNLTILTGLWLIKAFYESLSIHLGPSDNPDLHMP